MDQASRKFGRYEILAELGRGAMGIVYKARDPQIGRLVALKTVSLRGHDREQEAEYRERFRCEAQAAGRLQHPGIVAIYDVGEDQENHDPYIVLEFVNGESLNRILSREKKLPLTRALQLTEEIADALDYAHSQGVVHRDIKPANILIAEDGRAKIADFGIAQLNLAHFTLPGRVVGTPAYMAPEQLSGDSVDGRSDMFSLGVILYAMVTGHSPFHGNSATTVCFKVVNREPVPASAFDLDLPRALDGVISRAMAKEPAQRYQRGAEFVEDLRQVRLQLQPGSTTTSLHALSNGAGKTIRAKGKNSSDVGFVQAELLIRTAIQKTPVKYLIGGAALVMLFLLLAIPTRQAITTQKELITVPSSGGANASVPGIAKPRDTIIAEMNRADPTPASDLPAPATPASLKTLHTVKTHAAKKHPSAGGKTSTLTQVAPAPAPAPAATPTSMLELSVEHQFKEATLSVWIDDQLALTRTLHGGTQKKLVVFKGTHGTESESLQVPVGTHHIRVRAQTADQAIDLSKTISADFVQGDDKTLQVTFEKHNSAIRLTWH